MNNKHVARAFVLLFALTLLVASGGPSAWAQGKASAPGTVSAAKELLDLTEVPLMAGAKAPDMRTYAKLTYGVPGNVLREAFEFHRQQLLQAGWTQGQDGSDTLSTFEQDGYAVTLSTSILQAGIVTVKLESHGNVDLAKLPMPSGAGRFAVRPGFARFHVPTSVEATKKAVLKPLGTKGWQPYGEDKDVLYFKQNAVRLGIKVYPASKQVKGTLIDITPELLAHDLPAPPGSTELRYEDSTGRLTFRTKNMSNAVAEFYTKELTKKGWKAGTKMLTKSASGETMTFENPEDEPLTLLVTSSDGTTHVELKHELPQAAK